MLFQNIITRKGLNLNKLIVLHNIEISMQIINKFKYISTKYLIIFEHYV